MRTCTEVSIRSLFGSLWMVTMIWNCWQQFGSNYRRFGRGYSILVTTGTTLIQAANYEVLVVAPVLAA